jgi:hypothetical protein
MRVIALLRNSSSLIVVPFVVPLVVPLVVAYDGTYCETVSDRLVHQSVDDMTATARRGAANYEDYVTRALRGSSGEMSFRFGFSHRGDSDDERGGLTAT